MVRRDGHAGQPGWWLLRYLSLSLLHLLLLLLLLLQKREQGGQNESYGHHGSLGLRSLESGFGHGSFGRDVEGRLGDARHHGGAKAAGIEGGGVPAGAGNAQRNGHEGTQRGRVGQGLETVQQNSQNHCHERNGTLGCVGEGYAHAGETDRIGIIGHKQKQSREEKVGDGLYGGQQTLTDRMRTPTHQTQQQRTRKP